MKKLMLAGIVVGIAGISQAVTITLPSSLSYPNAYIIKTTYTLDSTLNYIGASITFNNVKYTVAGGNNTLNYDLLNGNYAAATLNNNTDEYHDYFQNHTPYSANLDVLGGKVFYVPGTGGYGKPYYDTESWTTTFSDQALADILNDITAYGFFDLGFDPNCTYQFNGTVTVDFTTTKKSIERVPDQGMAAGLLGMSFLGLVVLRRKLALN
jgi:hypothetical protein